jgi:hypothetical protein
MNIDAKILDKTLANSYQSPSKDSMYLDKFIVKAVWKDKGPRIAENNLEKIE